MNTYPNDWPIIAFDVKTAANWQCEHCGHQHDILGGHVLTVHHLDGIKSNCKRNNLVALCQRCHLRIQAQWHPAQMFLLPPPEWAMRRGYY
jgi:5-methylcytosine-specific restriction endonuclease McrA